MSYFVSITDFMRTTNLIFEAVWTPTLTSDTCITIAIAVTLIYTALFSSFLLGSGGGGRWGFSLFLLFFSCQHYFHFDSQNNKKKKQLKLVLVHVIWLRNTCLKNLA